MKKLSKLKKRLFVIVSGLVLLEKKAFFWRGNWKIQIFGWSVSV